MLPDPGSGRATPGAAADPRSVPDGVRLLTPLRDADYADHFALRSAGADRWTAQDWARAVVDDVAGRAGQVVWRRVLGLRLGPRRRPDLLAGWPVAGRGPGWVRLEAASRSLTGHLVFAVADDGVTLTTFVRHDSPWGRLAWAAAAPGHRRVVPQMLRDAHDVLRRRTGAR